MLFMNYVVQFLAYIEYLPKLIVTYFVPKVLAHKSNPMSFR